MPKRKPADDDRLQVWRQRLRPWCLAGAAALCTAAPLVPSERPEITAAVIPQAMLWLLLAAAWCLGNGLLGERKLRLDLVDWLTLAFAAMCAVSGLVMMQQGAPRPTINAVWTWIGMGLSLLLLRQLLVTSQEARAICAVMLAAAVLLSAHAFYENTVTKPAARKLYDADPEAALRQAGVSAAPGSMARFQFENRLDSSEPTATFSLTNSLAAYLAPWLCIALSVAAASWSAGTLTRRTLAAMAAAVVLIGLCLLLTKSRTTWLATLAALPLVAIACIRISPRLKWRLAAGCLLIASLLMVGVVGMMVGDATILSQAGDSVVYRVEYWQSTLRMIADHPLLGVGPGNFQEYYTAYKLPQASESISDPHNWPLELAANAGLPALLLLTGLMVAVGLRRSGCPDKTARPSEGNEHVLSASAINQLGIYLGLAFGIVLSIPVTLLAELPPQTAPLLLAAPLVAILIWMLHPWVVGGQLPRWAPWIGISVLLMNLLAAGGIGFPGVAVSLWVLLAAASSRGSSDSAPDKANRWPWLAGAVTMLGLLTACAMTAYHPVLVRHRLVHEANESTHPDPEYAIRWLLAAQHADPWSAEPPQRLAAMYQARAIQTDRAAELRNADLERFQLHAARAMALNPRAHQLREAIAWLYLEAGAKANSPELRQHGIDALERATELYPNNSMTWAELAWARHTAGDAAAARKAAQRAVQLDEANDHYERQLVRRRLFAEVTHAAQHEQMPPELRTKTALQWVEDLAAGGE